MFLTILVRLILSVIIFAGLGGMFLQAQSTKTNRRVLQTQKTTKSKNIFTAQGIDAFQKGDPAAARLLFERALKANQNDAEAHQYLGLLDDQAGDFKKAEIHFAKAVRLLPRSASTRNNYGAILLKNNRLREAAAEFEASLKIDPKQPNALVNLAQIRFNENTPAGLQVSFGLFERASALISDASVERSLIIIALRLNNPAQAAKHYQIYSALMANAVTDSAAAANRVELGGALFEAGLFAEAEAELKSVLAADPSNSVATVLLGRVYIARKDIKAAGILLETAVARKQATAEIYSLLAVVYEKIGRFENAIPVMRLAINLKPESENYRFQYGLLLTNAEAPAAAVIRLDEALKTFPNSPRLWLARGIAELKDNKNFEAAQSITKAIGLDPKFAQAHAYLGLTQSQIGEYDEAVKSYEKALLNDPNLGVVHQLIADAILQKSDGDLARIEAESKKSIALVSDFLPAHLTLGKLYVRMQRWTEAAAELNEVVRLNPDAAEAYYLLGRVYARLKQKKEQDAALAKFKQLSESQKTQSESDLRELVRRLADVKF